MIKEAAAGGRPRQNRQHAGAGKASQPDNADSMRANPVVLP